MQAFATGSKKSLFLGYRRAFFAILAFQPLVETCERLSSGPPQQSPSRLSLYDKNIHN